ncbi:hypothetical protein LOK49_LG15G01260 [Camellia lanceoleosa]|uniref:Uncharacterized protein n=1 Tax=Camellia lanceoleosa TaxID=1840588 RepID=A0ACC0F4D5_9ERIC|nr:hypothetical protein LOK49_Contig434G00004 [Camellia lanceoleosa]KAI7983532.1 hypothetical protein LOK49_LG15G01260 [Camellia lanceoleosa]
MTVVVDDSLRRLAREFPDLDPSGAEARVFTGFHHLFSSSSYWVSSSIEENGKSTAATAALVAVVAHRRTISAWCA